MRTWITLALLVSAALAGCAGEDTVDPDATSDGEGNTGGQNQTATQTSSTTPPASGDGNGTVPAANNTAPTADLSADVLNGTAPLNVTFTLEGSDADGDDLTWTLVVVSANATGNGTGVANGTQIANGTTLPATVAYNVTEPGNITAVLAVSDGTDTALANVTLHVSAGEGVPVPEDQHFTGTITGVWVPEAGYVQAGQDHTYDLPSQPATMTVHLAWARTGGGLDLDVYIYAPDGTQVAAGNNFNDPSGDNKEEELVVIEDAEALAQTGVWTFSVISAGSAAADYTLDVTFT